MKIYGSAPEEVHDAFGRFFWGIHYEEVNYFWPKARVSYFEQNLNLGKLNNLDPQWLWFMGQSHMLAKCELFDDKHVPDAVFASHFDEA